MYNPRKTGNNNTKQKIRNTYPPLRKPPELYLCSGGFHSLWNADVLINSRRQRPLPSDPPLVNAVLLHEPDAFQVVHMPLRRIREWHLCNTLHAQRTVQIPPDRAVAVLWRGIVQNDFQHAVPASQYAAASGSAPMPSESITMVTILLYLLISAPICSFFFHFCSYLLPFT